MPKRPTSRQQDAATSANPFISNSTEQHAHETQDERDSRIGRAHDAQRISLDIDIEIAEAKKAWDRKAKAVKILLLGQAESGKSTVLKNFQIAFTPKHFARQRAAWRMVIQMNLIKSVKTILEALEEEWGASYASPPTDRRHTVTSNHRRLRMALSPLLVLDTSLNRLLSPSTGSDSPRELSVRAGSPWQLLLSPTSETFQRSTRVRSPTGSSEDLTRVVAACRQDIIALWEDSAVREVLRDREVSLEASSGFFLHDTARIATADYEPTDADIVRARIRTMGVEEHKFVMETTDVGSEYYLIDVGGSRSMRAQWIPFFENVNAIIFLAPLIFNQVLEEDSNVNRLQDSLGLWKEICGTRLLQHTNIILFLNKIDVLQETLASGVRVQKYVTSYGDLPNDFLNVVGYFKAKFMGLHRRLSPKPRPFLCYETSAIDTQAMSTMLHGVREMLLRNNLEKAAVI